MFPYSVGVLTMLQGFYSLLWIIILMDISSPTFDLRRLPEWSGAQVGLVLAGLFTTAFAVGLVMHTLSRDLFRRYKDRWAHYVLTSPSITGRLNDLESCRPTGGPALSEVLAAEGAEGGRKAGEFIQRCCLTIRQPRSRGAAGSRISVAATREIIKSRRRAET